MKLAVTSLLRVTDLKTVIRVKRSKATTAYYDNSTSNFIQILQLLHDVETKPGSALNYYTNGPGKTNRSLKCRDQYVLVKETVLTNRFDIFTVSETWLNSTVQIQIQIQIQNSTLSMKG